MSIAPSRELAGKSAQASLEAARIAEAMGRGPDHELRELISNSIPRKKRPDVARKLSEKLGRKITLHMLNTFTARDESKARFPAAWVAPFCGVVGDDRLARLVMGPRLAALVQLGEALLELGEIDPQAQRLAKHLQRNGRRRKKARGRG